LATRLANVLDRTAEITAQTAEAERPGEDAPPAPRMRFGRLRGMARSAWQFFVRQSFSSLTRRIVILNLAGLVALVTGVLYLSQFRAGLIDARVQSLLVQSEIIAGAICDGRDGRDHHRSRAPARTAGRRKLRAAGGFAQQHRVSHQSRARCAGATSPGLADQDTRAHL
jgi:Sensor N-terminal transmembrane domain